MTASEAKPGAGFVTTFGQFRVCGFGGLRLCYIWPWSVKGVGARGCDGKGFLRFLLSSLGFGGFGGFEF